jgi:hypothetical protein
MAGRLDPWPRIPCGRAGPMIAALAGESSRFLLNSD